MIAKDVMNLVKFWIYSEDRADVLTGWIRVLEKDSIKDDSKVFGLSSRKNRVVIYLDREVT